MPYVGNYYNLNNFNVAPNFGNLGYASSSSTNKSPLAPLEKDTFTKTATNKKILKDTNDNTVKVEEYDPMTGNKVKEIWYQDDGKTISSIDDYDPVTGNKIKGISYKEDGKTISEIYEFDSTTGKVIYYEKDGKIIKSPQMQDAEN